MKKTTKYVLILALPLVYTLIVALTYFVPNWLGDGHCHSAWICTKSMDAVDLVDILSIPGMLLVKLLSDNYLTLPVMRELELNTGVAIDTITATTTLYLMAGLLLYMTATFFMHAWRRVSTGGIKESGPL